MPRKKKSEGDPATSSQHGSPAAAPGANIPSGFLALCCSQMPCPMNDMTHKHAF